MPKQLDYQANITGGLLVDVRLRIPVVAGDPGSPAEGDLWYNSIDEEYHGYVNGSVFVFGSGSGSLTTEQVMDYLGGGTTPGEGLIAGNNIDVTYDDGSNTITVAVETLTSADLTDFNTAVDARITAATIDADTLNGSTATDLQTAITAAIVDSAPGTLDTLNELAAALGDDANFATTITNLVNDRAKHHSEVLDDGATTATVTHNLNTRDVTVSFRQTDTPYAADREWLWAATDADTVTVTSEAGNIPTGYTVIVQGK